MFTKIILSGFGGQGILFAGKNLALCGMNSGCEISWLPSYGPEMRGGTANCSVCISDDPIGSPLVTVPDIAVVMNTPSFDRFEPVVASGGHLFVDSSMTDRVSARNDIHCHYIAASETAEKNGISGMANIIILGRMIAECKELLPWITVDTVKGAVKGLVSGNKEKLITQNMTALSIGAIGAAS